MISLSQSHPDADVADECYSVEDCAVVACYEEREIALEATGHADVVRSVAARSEEEREENQNVRLQARDGLGIMDHFCHLGVWQTGGGIEYRSLWRLSDDMSFADIEIWIPKYRLLSSLHGCNRFK